MTRRTRYPGSRPFTQDDEVLFFGREPDIQSLATFIHVEKAVVLYGKSGLGKSSLLNAGVLPRLRRQYSYTIVPFRLNSWLEGSPRHPLDVVEDSLAAMPRQRTFLDDIESGDVSFWTYIKSLDMSPNDRSVVLLVFDQFEELFTYPEGVDKFAETLSDLLYGRIPRSFQRALRHAVKSNPSLLTSEQHDVLERPVNVKILLSIRSDRMSFLDSLSLQIPSILQNCYELKPLSRNLAEAAIVQPAGRKGEFQSPAFSYEDDALEKILRYLTANGSKPIESFQLQILCEFVEEHIVIKQNDTLVNSQDLGDLETVYENYYERSLRKIGDEREQHQARLLMEEGLIFEQEERRIGLYEGQIQSNFHVRRELLQKLVDTHIIRGEQLGGGFVYELSHDTLVPPILRAKARRYVEEEKRKNEQLLKLRRQKRKKKLLRMVIAAPFLLLPALSIVLLDEGLDAGGVMSPATALAFLICLPFLLLLVGFVALAPFAFVLEFVTGESVLAWIRRRAEQPGAKGMLARIGGWLS